MCKGNHAIANVVKNRFIQILKSYIKFNLFIFTKLSAFPFVPKNPLEIPVLLPFLPSMI